MTHFRWGILSTAKIGWEHVIPAICQSDNGVVSAIASRNAENARALADRFGAPHAHGDYEALLASDEVDGIYIPLPTSMHVEWAEKCARAGKHVLCEKPIALKAGEIDRLIAARDESGVILSEAFMVTYHPQWHKVRDLIAEGAIGQLRQVDAAFSYFNRDGENMRNRPELGGGAIPDIGCYPAVTTRFATQTEPKRVQAVVEYDPDFGTDRYASVRADFGTFEQTFYVATQLANRQTIAFHGDDGFIEVTAPWNSNLYEGDEVRLHDAGHRRTETFRFTGVNQYRLEVEAFAKAAMDGDRSDLFSLEDSVRNQRFLDAIYEAGESGGWVEV